MKARPILFCAEMVRALLDGRKTQTRRLVKDPPTERDGYLCSANVTYRNEAQVKQVMPELCPHGRPGDLLWVREAWRVGKPCDKKPGSAIWPSLERTGKGVTVLYVAGGWESKCPIVRPDEPTYPNDMPMPEWAGRYRHARFMPRWASRLTLRVTDVRVERLQEISESDAIAEGIERVDDPRGVAWKSYEVIHEGRHKGKQHPHSAVPNRSPVTSYRELWESINGAESWAANPWCWAISFDVIEANVDTVMRQAA